LLHGLDQLIAGPRLLIFIRGPIIEQFIDQLRVAAAGE
jgi:hypothetical protein